MMMRAVHRAKKELVAVGAHRWIHVVLIELQMPGLLIKRSLRKMRTDNAQITAAPFKLTHKSLKLITYDHPIRKPNRKPGPDLCINKKDPHFIGNLPMIQYMSHERYLVRKF
jgi:hypothetical protein